MTRARSEEMGRIVPGLPLGWVKVKLKIITEINHHCVFSKVFFVFVYSSSSLMQSQFYFFITEDIAHFPNYTAGSDF